MLLAKIAHVMENLGNFGIVARGVLSHTHGPEIESRIDTLPDQPSLSSLGTTLVWKDGFPPQIILWAM
ncbi:unnamed protein product [Haemonchus placei]|uniref:Uncharacterized protein n=1 Tax=Haemonchus placei TaxID=6290 RepID=A0A3P7W4H1_HAEPC|nr:unnamed protein product [Haemonchus placei]